MISTRNNFRFGTSGLVMNQRGGGRFTCVPMTREARRTTETAFDTLSASRLACMNRTNKIAWEIRAVTGTSVDCRSVCDKAISKMWMNRWAVSHDDRFFNGFESFATPNSNSKSCKYVEVRIKPKITMFVPTIFWCMDNQKIRNSDLFVVHVHQRNLSD